MKKFQHPLCNDVLGAPQGVPIEQCEALPIVRAVDAEGIPIIQSFWMPDAEELAALNSGKPVLLNIYGYTHAPLFIGVAAD